jgi:hypothetical protein
VSDPLPPPADTPKPRPHYEEGKPLWFTPWTHGHGYYVHYIDREFSDGFYSDGEWYGPHPLPWQPAALPEGHDWTLVRAYAEAIANPHFNPSPARESAVARALLALLDGRAAAGGDKG